MTPEQLTEYERAWCDGDPDTDVNESRAIRELVGEVRRLTARVEELEWAVRWWRNWRPLGPGPKP